METYRPVTSLNADARLTVRASQDCYWNLQSSFDFVLHQSPDTPQGSVQLAEESLALARLRSSAGIGTQLDVISAETSLT